MAERDSSEGDSATRYVVFVYVVYFRHVYFYIIAFAWQIEAFLESPVIARVTKLRIVLLRAFFCVLIYNCIVVFVCFGG